MVAKLERRMAETSVVPADHHVAVSGRVTEVDLRYTQNGTPVLLVGLAGEDGRPYYLQVKALRGRAEYWADRLSKGTPVLAEAVLSQYKGQDGRTYTSLLAKRLELVDPQAVGESAPDARGNTREVPGLNLFVGRGVAVRVESRTPTLAVVRARFVTGGRRDERGYAPAAFVDVKGFDEVARELARVKEGQPFFVQGRLRVDTWEGKEGKRYELRVEALFVKPLLRESGGVLEEGKGDLEEFPPEDDLPF